MDIPEAMIDILHSHKRENRSMNNLTHWYHQWKPELWIRIRSVSRRYGSGSFYHQAKIRKKPWFLLFMTSLWLLIFGKMIKMYLQKVISRKFFLLASWRSMTKIAQSWSWSISQMHGSADPDPYQNVTDLQHWWKLCLLTGGSVWALP
jgi:hypothetical protein